MNFNVNLPNYHNILFLFFIKSIAPIVSLLGFFSEGQINQYLIISSYMQLFFFVWFLGQTSVLSYNIREAFSFLSVLRLSIFLAALLFAGVDIGQALLAAAFSLALGFNSFTDLRMKYFDIKLASVSNYLMLVPVIGLYVVSTIGSNHARLLLQIGVASIFFVPIYVKLRSLSVDYVKTSNMYVLLYAASTSMFTFFERQIFAGISDREQYFVFIGINVCVFVIFVADFWAKRSTVEIKFFRIFYCLTTIASLALIIWDTTLFYLSSVIQIAIIQFLTFSFYVVYGQKKLIILNIIFIGLYDVLLGARFFNFLDFSVYYAIYGISFLHGMVLFMDHKSKQACN